MLRKRKNLQKLNNGSQLNIPQDMAWAFPSGRYYEHNLMYWIEKIADKLENPVFYDVGANYGVYSLSLANQCKKCYAFEPVNSTYKILKSNIRKNHLKNVEAYKLALSDKSGSGIINIYSSSGNNSSYKRDIPLDHPTKFLKEEPIKFEFLDNLVKTTKILNPSIMKIDVEGAELAVLNGASQIIKKNMPVILVEYSETTSKDAGYKRIDLLSKLEAFGYKVYGLSGNTDDNKLYSPKAKKPNIENLIAVPNNLDINKW